MSSMSNEGAAILTFAVVGMNLAWLVPFVYVMRKQSKKEDESRAVRKRILESGHPAHAVVVSVAESGPSYNRVPHLDFTLQVEPTNEPAFRSSARGFFRMIDFARMQPGSRIEVRFDPADRSTVAIVGDLLR